MLPVVLIHGLIGPLAGPSLAGALRPAVVLSPDLLGYGLARDAHPDGLSIEAQVEFVEATLARHEVDSRVHLVGHSVGWVIAAAFAHRHRQRIASLIDIEGNFTLADAFWSRELAAMTPGEVELILEADRADPDGWLVGMGIEPTHDRLRSAAEALAYQPGRTVQAMARTVVDYTARPDYELLLQEIFSTGPVHLMAGERSRDGWDLPAWALAAAASYTEIPSVGHMMMLEQPRIFSAALRDVLQSAAS